MLHRAGSPTATIHLLIAACSLPASPGLTARVSLLHRQQQTARHSTATAHPLLPSQGYPKSLQPSGKWHSWTLCHSARSGQTCWGGITVSGVWAALLPQPTPVPCSPRLSRVTHSRAKIQTPLQTPLSQSSAFFADLCPGSLTLQHSSKG